MFTATDIKARLKEQPFRPLRVVTTTGETYDIHHPELLMVGAHFLILGTPTANDPTVAQQATRIAMLHVTELRDLPASAGQGNNGSAP